MEILIFEPDPDRKYVYMQNFNPFSAAVRYLDSYREIAERRYGYVAAAEAHADHRDLRLLRPMPGPSR